MKSIRLTVARADTLRTLYDFQSSFALSVAMYMVLRGFSSSGGSVRRISRLMAAVKAIMKHANGHFEILILAASKSTGRRYYSRTYTPRLGGGEEFDSNFPTRHSETLNVRENWKSWKLLETVKSNTQLRFEPFTTCILEDPNKTLS